MAIEMHRKARQVNTMLGSPKRSALLSGLIHAAAIVLIVVAARVTPRSLAPQRLVSIVTIDVSKYLPQIRSGGGGGGGGDLTKATKGKLPRFAPRPFTQPMVVVRNLNPILAMEPTILGRADTVVPVIALPNYGDPNGVDGPLSGGRGKCCGIGDGEGPGVGDGKGPGAGGKDGDGGIFGPGGSIRGNLTPPILLVKIEPEYSDEARRAKIQGTVVLSIEVDTHGAVHNISVKRSLGLGLDEKAIEAVRTWRFKAAERNGQAVAVQMNVEVSFRLY